MRLSVMTALLGLGLACAPVRQGLVRIQPRGGERAATAATGEVEGADGRRLLHRAAVVLRARGLGIASRAEGRIVTVPRELEVPCGRGTCLARELFVVRAVEQGASVEILRGVWDPAEKSWAMALAPSTAADAVAREAELLRAILEAAYEPGTVEVSLR